MNKSVNTIRSVVTVATIALVAAEGFASTIGYVAPEERVPQDWGSVTYSASKASSNYSGNEPSKTYDRNLSASPSANGWMTAEVAAPGWIMWDLGSSTTLSEASFWQYAQENLPNRAIMDYRFYVSDSPTGYNAGDPDDASWGSPVSSGTLPMTSWMRPMTYEQRKTFTPTLGRYVLLRADTSYPGASPVYPAANAVGLCEIGLNLPEPSPVTNGKYPMLWAKQSSIGANLIQFAAAVTVDGQSGDAIGGAVDQTSNGWFAWDLGATFGLTQFSAWNYAQNNPVAYGRGVKDFELYVTTDSLAFDPLANYGNGALSAPQLALWGSPVLTSTMTHDDTIVPYRQDFSFTGTGRYVLLVAMNNYGGNITGLSEVLFTGELYVPRLSTVITIR